MKKTGIETIDERIDRSMDKLKKMRDERVSAIEQFVGQHYGDGGADKAVPANLLELATTIYLRLLAARQPKCIVTTEDPTLKPFAADMEIVLNQIPSEIKLGDTIRRAVMEAMFAMGVVKVGIAGIDDRPNFGDEPFVSLVQMDDYFVDMSARSWDEIQYEGNEYWMDVIAIKEAYGVELPEDTYQGYSLTDGSKQARAVSNDEPDAELYPRVLLRDVYLQKENRMITYAVETRQVLRDIEWDGPEGTPYIKLWFSDVPGNLLPLPPMAVWRDLHDFSNVLYRKIANQAVSRKTVAVFQGGSDEEVARFRNAADGDAIRYSGMKPEEITVGGLDQSALALFLQNNDLMSRFAGNLDTLGGLSPQSGTAAQDKLINESASARVAAMGDAVTEFAKKIFKRLMWYAWTDPVRVRKYRKVYSKEFNIGEMKIWSPETRDGDFLDYNFDVAPFSMQDDSPTTRIQKLSEIMNTFIFPMMEMMMQQGLYVDAKSLIDYIAKNTNMPALADIVKSMDPNVMAQQMQPRQAAGLPQPSYVSTKSPVTRREYIRINRPGKMTEQGKNAVLAQALLGKMSQSAEMAGATGMNTRTL